MASSRRVAQKHRDVPSAQPVQSTIFSVYSTCVTRGQNNHNRKQSKDKGGCHTPALPHREGLTTPPRTTSATAAESAAAVATSGAIPLQVRFMAPYLGQGLPVVGDSCPHHEAQGRNEADISGELVMVRCKAKTDKRKTQKGR